MKLPTSPSRRPRADVAVAVLLLALVCSNSLLAQNHITPPHEQFGHNFGDDYWLANYKQLADYWHKLATQSDRIKIEEIGKTAEGRPHLIDRKSVV